MYTYIIYVTLNYKRTLYMEVAHTSYLTGSLNIFAGKTPVPGSNILFTRLFIDRKLYYNSSLSLNGSISPTSTSL